MASILAARQALNVFRLSISSRSASLIQRRGLAGASDLHGLKKVDSWKDPKSPSPSKEEHEVIFICIDTSEWMLRLRRSFQLQINSVRAYCRAKLKSNPKNEIGLFVMGTTKKVRRLDPTSNLQDLMAPLRCPQFSGGGELDILSGISSCQDKLDHYPNNPKRIVFFTGG
ncbi:26S proteasome non-ATPase regulatory subunit 4 homolog [Rutidosis leptorrhynchoides]|uniref:26S proteasome non-ATPase regulatory subunit 4 homolog n=1 Tax=Rutidosis leptorrhynchoides TaxID=125765 RepID=UPI003A99A56B